MPGPTEVDAAWVAQSPEQIARLGGTDSVAPDSADSTPVALGRVGLLINRLRDRLTEIQELPEDYRNESAVVVGMADLSRIIDLLVDMNDDVSSPKDSVAMLQVRLQEQEDQLARMFESGSDEASIQRQMDKIDRTQREIGRGGKKSSAVPSIDVFEHNFDKHLQRVRDQGHAKMHDGEFKEYQQYGDFLESHGRRRTGKPTRSEEVEGCDESCSLSHSNDGDCLECGEDWGKHSGHDCPDGSRGSWPIRAPTPPGGCPSTCSARHTKDGNCLVCSKGWNNHSGHNCSDGARGSWPMKPSPPGGCDASCSLRHGLDGNCLVCGKGWNNHSGHNCSDGKRGSWPFKPSPPGGCDASCSRKHGGDGNCLLCGKSWISHSGHNCSGGTARGSWPIKQTQSAGHNFPQDTCMICTKCFFCSGFGARCVNCKGKDRSSDRGNACGCGGGQGNCSGCGMCKVRLFR